MSDHGGQSNGRWETRSPEPGARPTERQRDGLLAALGLGACMFALRGLERDPRPGSVVAGAVAAIGFESLAATRRDRIRALWSRRAVQFGTFMGALAIVAVARRSDRAWIIGSMAGAQSAYLGLLAAVEFDDVDLLRTG